MEKEYKTTKQYTNVFSSNGITTTWVYDLDKFPFGPIEVNIEYDEGAENQDQEERRTNKKYKVPITQKKWLAPSGKMVGYTRAKNLGLIK